MRSTVANSDCIEDAIIFLRFQVSGIIVFFYPNSFFVSFLWRKDRNPIISHGELLLLDAKNAHCTNEFGKFLCLAFSFRLLLLPSFFLFFFFLFSFFFVFFFSWFCFLSCFNPPFLHLFLSFHWYLMPSSSY